MKTDLMDPGASGGLLESDSALARALQDTRTPLLLVLPAVAAYWCFEAVIHVLFFERHTFFEHLVMPDAHELWMRLIASAMFVGMAVAWRIAAGERRKRIASLERYQGRLHDLTLELAYADTEDRRALARRLHDDVGQQLAAARLFLASVEAELPHDDAALTSASRILDRATTEVREVAEELSPAALEEFGLSEALRSLARRVMRRAGVSIEVDIEPSCHIAPTDSSRIGFQVAAEVLEAAARDGAAERVQVRCGSHGEFVEITLEWNAATADDFFSASERLARIGGHFVLTSPPGETCVLLRIPHAA